MKPSRFASIRGISLEDTLSEIISEGIPLEADEIVTDDVINAIVRRLIDEVTEHMDAQYDKFRDTVLG